MLNEQKNNEKTIKTPQTMPDKPAEPELSNAYFARLLNLPTCKTEGYCSNCGRCEH